MRETDLYAASLSLKAPWYVDRVEFNIGEGRVDVYVAERGSESLECPDCGGRAPIHDHAPERTWRHLDTVQYITLLHAELPRVNCSEHGVKTVKIPWAEKHARHTLLFEQLVLSLYKEMSVKAVAKLLRVSWRTVWNIVERAVWRGLDRRGALALHYIGVDEKAIARRHRYATIVCDLERRRVVWVGIGRDSAQLASFLSSLTPQERDALAAIATDMWPAYQRAIADLIPNGLDRVVYDKFHAVQVVTTALDAVRRSEHREFSSQGDRSLTGTRWLWLTSTTRMNQSMRDRFEKVRTISRRTARAWTLKEAFLEIWKLPTRKDAETYFKRWYNWAIRSGLPPMKKAAQKIARHVEQLFNYYDHPVTTALNESLNAQIETIKRVAHGIKNPEHFRAAIYFHCGGLDTSPAH